jgi:thiamine pyrophosphokinase
MRSFRVAPLLPRALSPGAVASPAPVVVATNAPLFPPHFQRVWRTPGAFRFAADGGANAIAAAIGREESASNSLGKSGFPAPDAVVGDLDSATEESLSVLRRRGAAVVGLKDQDTTDLEKVLLAVRSGELGVREWEGRDQNGEDRGHRDTFAGENRVRLVSGAGADRRPVVVAGSGGNLSQELSNLSTLFAFEDLPIFLLGFNSLAFVLPSGRSIIHAPEARGVSGVCAGLLPLRPVSRVTTKGLRWNLDSSAMGIGEVVSTSNVMVGDDVEVETSDPILFMFDFREDRPAEDRRIQLDEA